MRPRTPPNVDVEAERKTSVRVSPGVIHQLHELSAGHDLEVTSPSCPIGGWWQKGKFAPRAARLERPTDGSYNPLGLSPATPVAIVSGAWSFVRDDVLGRY